MVALLVLGWGLLAPLTSAQTTTQTIHLSPGKNLISLSVRPTDPALESLFGEVLGDIVSVKDAAGRHFAPGYADDLEEWDWTQSYVVYADRALALRVTGSPIEEGTGIPLQARLNAVPYTHSYPMLVADAFHELADVLEYVEDGEGRRYPATAGRAVLHQLEPGKGYFVYMSEALSAGTTLTYPTAPTSFDGDIDVNTMAEALALRGLEPGQTVGVSGYYRPGDGGGGLFEVRNSGAPTDGGLVFVPDEFVSEQIDEAYAVGTSTGYRLQSLPQGQSVVFGSLSVVLDNLQQTAPVAASGIHLHGHAWASPLSRRPYLDYATGIFTLHRELKAFFDDAHGGQTNSRIQFSYRHTTSPLRLHRLGSFFVMNTHWFGVRPAVEGPMWTGSTDVQPLLAHIINVAADRNAEVPESVSDILLPATETYDYFGSIELADGLTLRGAGGTELVTFTNDLGHTYQPVRVKASHTRLRVMDGEALTHIRMVKNPSDPNALAPDVKAIFNCRPTSLSPEPGAMSFGVQDLVMDGNWENNMQAWEEGWTTNEEREQWMRNSPGWAAIAASDHNGKRIPQGQKVLVRNVSITGYGASGLLGEANNTWTVENVILGNSLWNHVTYGANGEYTNLTLVGFAWGHAAWIAGTINNLVYEQAAESPTRQAQELFFFRGTDVFDRSEIAAAQNPYLMREDGTPAPSAARIEGFYIDMRGSGLTSSFQGYGPEFELRGVSEDEPGRIVTDGRSGVGSNGVFWEQGNGYQRSLYSDYIFEDIILYEEGRRAEGLFRDASLTNTRIHNVRAEMLPGSVDPNGGPAFAFTVRRRDHPSWDTPQEMEISEVRDATPRRSIAGVAFDGINPAGLTVQIRESSFNNQTGTLYGGMDGTGSVTRNPGPYSALRVEMSEVEFNMIPGERDMEIFFATTTFANSTDVLTGRTSEDSGTYTVTAADASRGFALIGTDLFWVPQERPFDPGFDGRRHTSIAVDGVPVAVYAWAREDGTELAATTDNRAPWLRVNGVLAGQQIVWSSAVRPHRP